MPRLGLGSVDLSALGGTGQDVVTTIDDFLFESFSAGQMHPILTTSRTNLLIYSEDFSQWTRTGDTDISATNITSPTGTTNATRITGLDGDGSNDLRFFPNSFNSANRTLTFSVHLKGSGTLRLQMSNGIDQGIQEVVTLTSDWKRHTFTGVFNSTTTSTTFHVNIDDSTATATTYDIWGVQLEEDGFVSNYIPTSGSTVTVSTTLNDTSNVWDFDGTDIMIAEDPEDEGFWEESYPNGASLPELVLNGDYEELGSDVIINGGFDTDSDWTKGTGWTISGGTASCNNTSGSTQNLETEARLLNLGGQNVKIEFTVSGYSGSADMTVTLEGTGTNDFNDINANGTYTTVASIGASENSIDLLFKAENGWVGSIDNVSIKKVDPNDRWSLGTGWSISDGKAVFSGTDFANLQLSSAILNIGDTYELTLTAAVTNGSFKVQHSGSSDLITQSSSGTYSVTFTATATSFTIARATVGSQNDFTIDNLTVREYAIQPLDI